MDRETYKRQQAYAGDKVSSMKRRCPDHDYTERRMYMVTLATEGRRKLLGEVRGRSDAPKSSTEAPRLVLSELGKAVEQCGRKIPEHHPEVRLLALQMMPDHLHGILFVRQKMETGLGKVILGFKQGCNKEYRRLAGGVAMIRQQTQPEGGLQQAQPEGGLLGGDVAVIRQQTQPEGGLQQNGHEQAKHTGHEAGLLFERGYNDRILLQDGQLQHWIDYLEDNPRRLLAKREHPDLFRVNFGLQYGSQTYAAIGNRFLLQRPYKLQVQCSRKLTAEEIKDAVDYFLGEARKGAVLVSPALSPGEKAVMRAAIDAQLPTIYLSPTSFSSYTKPGGAFTEACARGHFLILAPWSERTATQSIKRNECLMLNDMAKEIATFQTTF